MSYILAETFHFHPKMSILAELSSANQHYTSITDIDNLQYYGIHQLVLQQLLEILYPKVMDKISIK